MTSQQTETAAAMIAGIPEHLNQYSDVVKQDTAFLEALTELKAHHLISSKVGAIASTAVTIEGQMYRLITVGLGNLNQLKAQDYLKIWGKLFQYLQQGAIANINLKVNTFLTKAVDSETIFNLMGLQSEQAIYQFDDYKSDKKAPFRLRMMLDCEQVSDYTPSIDAGQKLGRAINRARDLSNTPPNIMTPAYLAETVEQYFKDTSVKVLIKDEHEIEQEGFGLVQAVGKGSVNPPRIITLEYRGNPEQEEQVIALVGKGITYDSGGYSIKSKNGMPSMKFDMSGAANVIGMVEAIQALKLKINIVAVIASAENMIANNAMKPDDVFTALSGETVEVPNTDAEGRLVLADATFYANQYKPEMIMDFATLTGAAVVALGEDKAAVFQHRVQPEVLNQIFLTSQIYEEPVFELPITDTERQNIKASDVADLTNHVNAHGKALFAAAFITHFSGQTPHLHFDIAGPATINKATHKGPKGPTGFMIPTIVTWLKNQYGLNR
ncbi:leucyl aminopeptidase family protein [Staphylococcus intermedius]|uniref:Probable cytosol aminopeptidase n=1 Tax=Staphylococcus intermedius NCTC 11048 TaxID=1141106 RepID=A0A380GA65_STAIN|nr:leucyl aminopeptidase family protein [Staphylococcus intermedius]PCF65369.1 aminopeptidase [Staphylococcus intermedius]PCF81047.1 aminopeptidase [Staphylococcus intermedius]PCF82329.1 aminopeptidase [Staphylococcus intermedius]PCF87029.1 aminopeptidase [Staphylococcus intermedius]PCF87590.1 aminopeptidase [Staphylococcus intermedius]